MDKKFSKLKDWMNSKKRDGMEIVSEKEIPYIFLFLAILSAVYLPYILKTITVSAVQNVIPSAVSFVYDLLGMAAALALGMAALKRYKIFEKKSYLRSILYVASACMLYNVFYDFVYGILLSRMLDKIVVFWVIYFAVFVLIALLLAMALPIKGAFISNFLICIGFVLIYELAAALLKLMLKLCNPSFASMSFYLILISFVISTLINLLLKRNIQREVKNVSVISYIIPGLAFIISLAGTVYFAIPSKPWSIISVNIYTDMQNAAQQMMLGNADLALQTLRDGIEKRNFWYSICGEKGYEDYNAADSDYMQIRLIAWEQDEDCSSLEKYLSDDNYNIDIGKHYLKLCTDSKKRGSRKLKDKIVDDMIANNSFVLDTLTFNDIEDSYTQIRDELDNFRIFDKYEQALAIVASVDLNGLTYDDVDNMLMLAEENKNDIYLQYLAAEYGTSYQTDSASHYDRTADTILRYKKLYEESYGSSEAVTGTVLDKLYMIRQYDAIVKLVTGNSNPSDIEQQYLALCYMKMDDYDSCLEAADKILKKDAKNHSALYYVAYCTYKKQEMDESLKAACQLADEIKELSGEEKKAADAELFLLIQNYTVTDGVFSTRLGKPSEEQVKIIESSDILEAYYYASYYAYMEKDTQKALKYVDEVLKIAGDLSNAYYLRGNIYMSDKKFDNAVDAYRKSLTIVDDSVVAWYALANAYDALEDYENAYNASVRASQLLASTDHGNDPYGVAIHNGNLLNSLKSKVEDR